MIFGNLGGDQVGFLAWAEKAIQAGSYSEFVRWPVEHGAFQDLRAMHSEAPYLFGVFKLLGWLTAPLSGSDLHAMNTLLAAYLLHLLMSLASVFLFARLYTTRRVAWAVSLFTCLSLSWWARSSGHFNLTAFFVPFSMVYLMVGAPRWTLRRRLLTGAVVGVFASASYYYLYLASVVLGFTLLSQLALWLGLRRRVSAFPNPITVILKSLPGVLVAGIVFGALNTNLLGTASRFGADTSISVRGGQDINIYSNKSADFFMIHRDSPEHLVFGFPAGTKTHGSNPTEQSVFLGFGGSAVFFFAIALALLCIRRGVRLEVVIPLTLLLFWSWHVSLSTVANRISMFMPVVRAYGRIAILVLPTALILLHTTLPEIFKSRRALLVLNVCTALLMLWPVYYGRHLISSLISFNGQQVQAIAFVDRAGTGQVSCLEFFEQPQCSFATTDGFKLFLAARFKVGIRGVKMPGARTFSEGTTRPYAKGDCLEIPREIYLRAHPGYEGPGC